MANIVEIENIEEMRRREGIDDIELRVEIRTLRVGDFVKLTFVTGSASFETTQVRITRIRGSAFRGKLVGRLPAVLARRLGAGAIVAFTTDHIHSLQKQHEVEA